MNQSAAKVTIQISPEATRLGRPRGYGLTNEQAQTLAQRLGLTPQHVWGAPAAAKR